MREFIARTTGTVLGGSVVSLTACGNGGEGRDVSRVGEVSPARPRASGPAREVRIVAREAEVELAPGTIFRTWMYDGQCPGPEIRVTEGERLIVTVENQLPEGTTIHWHGIPVPNDMDGVPGLTQEPIAPGETFRYDFVAGPAGSYLYHSHVGLQIDRGLIAPLIIEERSPHVEYDREYTLILDDYLSDAPESLERGMMGNGMMGRRMMRDGQHGMMDGAMVNQVPPYEAMLINGKPAADPPSFEARQGERIRLRLLNPSGASTFRVAVQEHPLIVTHVDGQPLEPVTVDAIDISMGERYDAVIEADNPGAWAIVASPIEGVFAPARAVLRYADSAARVPSTWTAPTGRRRLRLGDLRSVEPVALGSPDRTFDLTLSGGMMMSDAWTIDGQAYPDAEPLEVNHGEVVRVRMTNHSPMIHPMHLHGHFFRVGNVTKDTVLVPPHMGQVTFDFLADNPGRWFFHCHNIYHMEAGMAREVRIG